MELTLDACRVRLRVLLGNDILRDVVGGLGRESETSGSRVQVGIGFARFGTHRTDF